MYKYETHLHTFPVSCCAAASVEETLKFYKELGYDGIIMTNHFPVTNGNDGNATYEETLQFYFSDYEKALQLSKTIGIKVFLGIETTYRGTDFLVYGLDKDWFFAHPEIMNMKQSDKLTLMRESGAFIIQAHPFREASYINHIRLFPRHVEGVEIVNGNRPEAENDIAKIYCEHYGLIQFAGSDNHTASKQEKLAGMCFEEPLSSIEDFIEKTRNHKAEIFTFANE